MAGWQLSNLWTDFFLLRIFTDKKVAIITIVAVILWLIWKDWELKRETGEGLFQRFF